MSDKKIIGYAPIYEAEKGQVVTMAFLVCSQCKGLISTVGGPRSEAVCLACVTGTSDKELESLRTQLADATRKLEEASKDALGEIRMLVRSDAVASGFQTLGQYRKMLSEEITRAIEQGKGGGSSSNLEIGNPETKG
jgi:hypothetical protein